MTRRTLIRRRHHPPVWLALGIGLLAAYAVAWAVWLTWHLLPLLLALAAVVVACKRWQIYRRALGRLNGNEPTRPPRLVHGHVITEVEDLRRQVAKLEDDADRSHHRHLPERAAAVRPGRSRQDGRPEMTRQKEKTLAARIVTGVAACMVVATTAATAVGFWLSYRGLHDFALRAGLHGPEAWAWPASVDLFIAAGEAGVTISALRRHQDRAAWIYLAIGFAASVTGNVLHVDPAGLFWTRYAVAAVPPVAAMLALAALLRQAYRLATEPVPVTAPERTPAPHPASAPALNGRAHPTAPVSRTRGRSPKRTRSAPVTPRDAEAEFMTELASGALPSIRQIRARLHVGQERARVLREHLEALVSA